MMAKYGAKKALKNANSASLFIFKNSGVAPQKITVATTAQITAPKA